MWNQYYHFLAEHWSVHLNEAPNNEINVDYICLFIVEAEEMTSMFRTFYSIFRANVAHTPKRLHHKGLCVCYSH